MNAHQIPTININIIINNLQSINFSIL